MNKRVFLLLFFYIYEVKIFIFILQFLFILNNNKNSIKCSQFKTKFVTFLLFPRQKIFSTQEFNIITARIHTALNRAPFPSRKVQQLVLFSKSWAKQSLRRLIHSGYYDVKFLWETLFWWGNNRKVSKIVFIFEVSCPHFCFIYCQYYKKWPRYVRAPMDAMDV